MSRVLVCVVGQIRASALTWSSFHDNVVKMLGADVAVCTDLSAAHDPAEPFLANAQYRFDASRHEPLDCLFDKLQADLLPGAAERPDWRQAGRIPGNWLGGLAGIPGSGAIMMYQRWCLLRGLQQSGLIERYDRFVFTRSDFLWAATHPPMSLLSSDRVWVPQGEDHEGLNDRHAVVAAQDVPAFLDVLGPMLLRPNDPIKAFAGAPDINFEQYLGWCVRDAGLASRIRRMPYTMFLVREPDGPTNWTTGSWDEDLGCYVKLRPECDASFATHALFSTPQSWCDVAPEKPQSEDIVMTAELCGLSRPWSLVRCPLPKKTMPSERELVRTGVRVRIKTGVLEVIESASRCAPNGGGAEWERLRYIRPHGRDSRRVKFRDAFYVTTPDGMLLFRRDGRVRSRRPSWVDGLPFVGRLWNLVVRLTSGSLFTFVRDPAAPREAQRPQGDCT